MRPIAIFTLVLPLLTSACFYDHRWYQQRQAQQAALAKARPAELRATPVASGGDTDIPAPRAERVLRVRAHATARHASEVVDWPRQLAQLLAASGEILGPTLGIRLEVTTTDPWTPRGGEEDLGGRLDELAALDDGRDVDWVIGLLGSVPRAERSFHQLGMGRMPGKHLVMRAMNDAREYEAIEQAFARESEAERRALHVSRKRHKAVTVLLHELGHTLGVPHETDAASIMHGSYDPRAAGYSDAAAGLMRLSLARRQDPAAQTPQAFAAAFAAQLEAGGPAWVPAEREEMLARLRAVATPPPGPPGRGGRPRPRGVADEAPPPSPEEALAELAIADRNAFRRAVADKDAGRLREAWEGVKPLFKVYPEVYAVQELRCQLAMAAAVAFSEVSAQCEPMLELVKKQGKKR